MTLNDLVALSSRHTHILVIGFIIAPCMAMILPLFHRRANMAVSAWRYVYSALIYLTAFPGIFALALVGYALFFTRSNLMNVNVLVYFFPILSMIITLAMIKKRVSFDHIPGFDRIYGLMTLMAVTFIIILIIQKTRIWLLFGGSIYLFFGLAVFLFALLKWGTHRVFRSKNEKKQHPPVFPYKP